MNTQNLMNYIVCCVSILFLMIIAACSDNSVGTTNDELDSCFGRSLPFPETATITSCQSLETGGRVATFEPGISWSKSLDFFSKQYSSGNWTLTREEIPTETAGERTADWWAEGNGVEVGISITAFGDSSTGFMVGVIGFHPEGSI